MKKKWLLLSILMPTICSAIALPVFLTQYNTNKNSLINTSANTSSITSYTIFDLPESGEMGMSTGNCGYFPFKVVDNNGDQVTSGLSIYDSTSSNIYWGNAYDVCTIDDALYVYICLDQAQDRNVGDTFDITFKVINKTNGIVSDSSSAITIIVI